MPSDRISDDAEFDDWIPPAAANMLMRQRNEALGVVDRLRAELARKDEELAELRTIYSVRYPDGTVHDEEMTLSEARGWAYEIDTVIMRQVTDWEDA